ncbi:MAG: endonuclease III domain-containing protein [Gammaproteobacteria bacterium]
MASKRQLMTLYQRLLRTYGPQDWWPGESRIEVMVGAVLTQNTAWVNVEKAVSNLKQAGGLDPDRINAMRPGRLARLIRPSGYYNVKAGRLKHLCRWFSEGGGFAGLDRRPTDELRASLLKVKGVGPETADAILLYAFERPVFVIDAYTRRLLAALSLVRDDEVYETLRALFESRLPADPALFNEYHALIVRHGKERCSDAPGCRHCHVEKRL